MDDVTLREWKAAGVLQSAVAKVLARQAAAQGAGGGKAMRGKAVQVDISLTLG